MVHRVLIVILSFFVCISIEAQTFIYLPVILKDSGASTKKGSNAPWPPVCQDLVLLQANWYQTWSPYSIPMCPGFIPRISNEQNFINDLNIAVQNAAASGWLIGFTEPDFTNRNNHPPIDPIRAAIMWRQIEAAALPAGVRLVSPTPSHHNPAWLWQFVLEYKRLYGDKPHFDAIGYNAYFSDSAEMRAYLEGRRADNLTHGYDVPIWVIEFGGECWAENNGNLAIMTEILPWLEQTDWIGRYAWFANRINYFNPAWGSCALIEEATGELSPLGDAYR